MEKMILLKTPSAWRQHINFGLILLFLFGLQSLCLVSVLDVDKLGQQYWLNKLHQSVKHIITIA